MKPAMFRLKRPCENCPFLKEGAIELRPSRLQGIIDQLVNDDMSNFQCHKTVHHPKTGGSWSEEGGYEASGKECMCAGAMIYLEKAGRPTVAMRLGSAVGIYDRRELEPAFDEVIDPKKEG